MMSSMSGKYLVSIPDFKTISVRTGNLGDYTWPMPSFGFNRGTRLIVSDSRTACIAVYKGTVYVFAKHTGQRFMIAKSLELRDVDLRCCTVTDDGDIVRVVDNRVLVNTVQVYTNVHALMLERPAVCSRTGTIVFAQAMDPSNPCIIRSSCDAQVCLSEHDRVSWMFSHSGRLFYVVCKVSDALYTHCVYSTCGTMWKHLMTVECVTPVGRVSKSDEMLYVATRLGVECHYIGCPGTPCHLIEYCTDLTTHLLAPPKSNPDMIHLLWPCIVVVSAPHDGSVMWRVTFPHAMSVAYLALDGGRHPRRRLPQELLKRIADEYLDMGPFSI